MKDNNITLIGTIVEPFVFDHEEDGERFFSSFLSIDRKSETKDILPFIVSEKFLNIDPENDKLGENKTGSKAKIRGEIRSTHKNKDGVHHLLLYVFAEDFSLEEDADFSTNNSVILNGFIIKPPVLRETPFGKIITDLLIAVNCSERESDYIPAIAWGRYAIFAADLKAGEKVLIHGRFQSRPYTKQVTETETEDRVAYEVSVREITRSKSQLTW